jgi:hypothetical protein
MYYGIVEREADVCDFRHFGFWREDYEFGFTCVDVKMRFREPCCHVVKTLFHLDDRLLNISYSRGHENLNIICINCT